MLSDSDSDSDATDLHTLTINEHYAKAFEYRKEREELERLKDKYGSDAEEDDDDESSSTDSEEGESEDEDGEELTPAVDAAILRTLARIKRKDPEIYNVGKDIFEEEQKKTGSMRVTARAPKDKSKPVTMRQVALESALNPTSRSPSPEPVPHVVEQRALREETIAAFHKSVQQGEGEEEDDGLLVPREKTKDEMEREEEEYRAFLEREVGNDLTDLVTVEEVGARDSNLEEPAPKKGKRSKEKDKRKRKEAPKQETDQEFLMNYILNRGWIDRTTQRIPTYGEITSTKGPSAEDGDDPTAEPTGNIIGDNLDEDDFEEIVDRFESSYNFRFEEPDAAVIKSYPRDLPSVVRREDTTRKEARERKKQRKEEELLKKKEEVKRLKGLKMKELRAKLDMIGREGGIKNVDQTKALQELQLDDDWDPHAHDEQMAGLYGNSDNEIDGEKPHWDDDIDIGDIAIPDHPPETTTKSKKKKKKKKKDGDGVDEGVDVEAMDADVEHPQDDGEWDGTEEMRKKKLDEYMDEIYGLEFNDMVGDMPTRFKYAPVQPQSFALTPAEILMATDAELNEYLSVKRYAPYRKEIRWDSTRNNRLAELKQKVAERAPSGWDASEERPAKKRKGKKERQKMRIPKAPEGNAQADATVEGSDGPLREKRKRVDGDDGEEGVEASREVGKTGKKRRRHKKATAQ